MLYHPWVLPTYGVLCIIGLITNSLALVYVVKSLRKVQRSLFFLLTADSVTSLICLSIYLSVCAALYFQPANETLCSMLFVALHTPSLVGAVSTAQIAFIRFISLVLTSRLMQIDDRILLCVNVFIVSLLYAVALIVGPLHIMHDLPLSVTSETCLNLEHPRKFLVVTNVYGIAPQIISLIVNVVFDFLIIAFIKRNILPQRMELAKMAGKNLNPTTYDAIPAKATLLSALILLPYLIIAVAIGMHSKYLGTKAAVIIGIIAMILNTVRFPVAVIITFNRKRKRKKQEQKFVLENMSTTTDQD